MKLTAELVEAFAGAYLSPQYDNPQPTPDFHRTGWKLYCSDLELCEIVAPREHAKSTAFTHDFVLANICFRAEPYVIIVSATEDLAKDHLADIAKVLREDDDVRREFMIVNLTTDAKTEIIVRFTDGYEARILAKGAGQKMRGLKWKGRRPGLIVCDDLEEDEQVENVDRRIKFRKWFFRALLPCRRRYGKVRVHGTILHDDSLLARIHRAAEKRKKTGQDGGIGSWHTLFFKAHGGFDDFSDILWPEQFPPERLAAIRQGYVDQQDASGYSQEYLNDPLDSSDAYLKRDWFTPATPTDLERPMIVCAAADFAVSKKDKANRTSLTVGGMPTTQRLTFLDQHVGRWDAAEIVDEMFDVQKKWNPDVFWVEDGQIWKAIKPFLLKEMQKRIEKGERGVFINFVARTPISDKASRGRSLQKRMKCGMTLWDTDAGWFVPMQEEMLRFTGHSEATLDDQFDSAALLSLGFDTMADTEDEDLEDEEVLEMRRNDPRKSQGRSKVTGY